MSSMASNIPLDRLFDADTLETIAESPVSYITSARYRTDSTPLPQRKVENEVFAIKTGSIVPEFSKQPHDIRKELRILNSLSHPNIISIVGSTYDMHTASLHFWMPLIPYSLTDLLTSPLFTPFSHTIHSNSTPPPERFEILARSLTYQLLSALTYLHAQPRRIAHRDIKPHNILISLSGCIQLIDFGIAYCDPDSGLLSSSPDELLWPEPRDAMCAHVCSGPYRAPETLFGPRTYDPFAVDLWSAGVTLAEFFTRLRFRPRLSSSPSYSDEDDSWDEDKEEDKGPSAPQMPYCVPPGVDVRAPGLGEWVREPLFDASKGAIGLAWNIFKIRGSPTEQNWPTFHTLPDANKISFIDTPVVDLQTRLPNIPPTQTTSPTDFSPSCSTSDICSTAAGTSPRSHFPPPTPTPTPLDLIQRLLVYPPERRLPAAEALHHPWLSSGPLLLPPELLHAQNEAAESTVSEGANNSKDPTLQEIWLAYI